MNDLLHDASPKAIGLSKEQFARIDQFLQGLISRQELAGIVTLVAHGDQVVHSTELGFRDVLKKRPMTTNSIFRIASMTKPITSVAAMILFEGGHFKLTDPISAYIPEFKEVLVYSEGISGQNTWEKPVAEITFQHLFTHTSGLGYPESYNRTVGALYEAVEPNASNSLTILAKKLARLPLFIQPGSQWQYGYSHDVLARLVEIISGCDFGQFIEQEIFEPLGMVDTAHFVPVEKIDRLAQLYQKEGGSEFSEVDIIWPDSPPDLKPGGHGLFSTAEDYLHFAQMLLNGGQLGGSRLLNPESIELMTANHLRPDLLPFQFSPDNVIDGCGYGFGFGVVLEQGNDDYKEGIGSYYWDGAYGTTFVVIPQKSIVAIFMTQITSAGTHPFKKQFRALVNEAVE